jgi:hypothetical protein
MIGLKLKKEVLSTCDIYRSAKMDSGRFLESDITLARHTNRWGKTELLLSYQIHSFVVQ